jgi:SAM-dependent methyltransferase
LLVIFRGVTEMQINNRFLEAVWNSFDFFVRFMYCRFGIISGLFFWKIYSSNPQSLDKVFDEMYTLFKEYNVPIEKRSFVEIGPGNSNILALNFLMLGASNVILVDKFPRMINTGKQKEFLKNEITYIKQKYNKNPSFIQDNSIDKKYLDFISSELTESNLTNIDIIYSNNVLEHIKNVELNIKSMWRTLKPGGFLYHNIDLRDHYNFNSPFLFYKYDDQIWQKYLTREGVSYTNRLRYDDFIRLFTENGFEIIHYQIKKQEGNMKNRSSKYKNKDIDSLQTTNMSILLRKMNA